MIPDDIRAELERLLLETNGIPMPKTAAAIMPLIERLVAKLAAAEAERDGFREGYKQAIEDLRETQNESAEKHSKLEAKLAAAEANLELSRTSLEMSGRCDRCGVQWNPANYSSCPVCVMDIANDSLRALLAAAEAERDRYLGALRLGSEHVRCEPKCNCVIHGMMVAAGIIETRDSFPKLVDQINKFISGKE